MDIMTAFSAVSQALDGVKKLREIEKDFDAAALKLQVSNLASSLADAKLALVDVQTELSHKDAEIERLKNAFKFQRELVEYRQYLYEANERGKAKGSPFCPVCIVDNAVHIKLVPLSGGIRGDALCPRCNAKFSKMILHAENQMENQ